MRTIGALTPDTFLSLAFWLLLLSGGLYFFWREFVRPASRRPLHTVLSGLLWIVEGDSYYGPCCHSCLTQYTCQPAFRTPEGIQHYILRCPLCGLASPKGSFTLARLLRRELDAATRLGATIRREPFPFPISESDLFELTERDE